MKYTCTVRTKTNIYKFDSKDKYDQFQRQNENLHLKVVERIDIMEEMDKIVQPPKVTVKMVWDKLNNFILKQEAFNNRVLVFMENQMKFNQLILNRLDKIENRLETVIRLNNLKTE